MISKLIRRTHMYLALFLTPWILIYALSTIVMNHRSLFRGETPVAYEKERELHYDGSFPPNATPRMMAEQLLHHLQMEGAYGVRAAAGGREITITRQHPVSPRRVSFTPADGKVVVEKEAFRTPAFLERMHRRRGFQHDDTLEDAWAFSVDLVIVALVFWVASGLWMWWEMRATRFWGAVSAAAGLGLFGFFLATI